MTLKDGTVSALAKPAQLVGFQGEAAAERAVRGSTQFFPFTRAIVKQISPEERGQIGTRRPGEVFHPGMVAACDQQGLERHLGYIR